LEGSVFAGFDEESAVVVEGLDGEAGVEPSLVAGLVDGFDSVFDSLLPFAWGPSVCPGAFILLE